MLFLKNYSVVFVHGLFGDRRETWTTKPLCSVEALTMQQASQSWGWQNYIPYVNPWQRKQIDLSTTDDGDPEPDTSATRQRNPQR